MPNVFLCRVKHVREGDLTISIHGAYLKAFEVWSSDGCEDDVDEEHSALLF